MAPHSPGTDQIDTLLWIGFVAAAIVVVAINVALLYAVRRYRGERGAEPRQAARRPPRSSSGSAPCSPSSPPLIFILSIVFTDKARETPATGAAGLAAAEDRNR